MPIYLDFKFDKPFDQGNYPEKFYDLVEVKRPWYNFFRKTTTRTLVSTVYPYWTAYNADGTKNEKASAILFQIN